VEGGEQLRQEQGMLLCGCNNPLARCFSWPCGTRRHACRHPPFPSVLAHLLCRGLGAHGMASSSAQVSTVTPRSGASHWPHRGDPPALQMGINRHSCPRQSLQLASCPPSCSALSQPSTCTPVAVTWIASCFGPLQGWEVIHVCPCMGTRV